MGLVEYAILFALLLYALSKYTQRKEKSEVKRPASLRPKKPWKVTLQPFVSRTDTCNVIFDKSTLSKYNDGMSGVYYVEMFKPERRKVAMKTIIYAKIQKRFVRRELIYLEKIGKHPRIVDFIGFYDEETQSNLFFEFLRYDLKLLLREYATSNMRMDISDVKIYSKQLFEGLDYLNTRSIVHLDLKPPNILISEEDKVLKIGDFGSASEVGIHSVSEQVTLHYRPPELIFNTKHFTTAIDWWSAGCVLAEMCTNYVLLPGSSIDDQKNKIIKLLGQPTMQQWTAMKPTKKRDFKGEEPNRLDDELAKKRIPLGVRPILKLLFQYDPIERASPSQILRNEFFNNV